METPTRERVISISLNESEWQAFVRLHPQPVTWLREQIQASLRPRAGQPIADQPVIAVPAATAAANRTSATTR